MRVTLFTVAVLVLALAFSSVPAPAPAADTASIYVTLGGMNDHTILYVAIKEGGAVALLDGRGGRLDRAEPGGGPPQKKEEYTLFAPSDAAFKKLDDATIKQLATDPAALKKLIRAHLVLGKKTADDLKTLDGKNLQTLQGGALRVEQNKDELRIGGGRIVTANIPCSNGVIHVIDTVLPVTKE